MKDVVNMEVFPPHFEVEAKLPDAESVERFRSPPKVPEWLPGMRKLGCLEAADRMNRLQLGIEVELVQLVHRLVGKSYLLHPGN